MAIFRAVSLNFWTDPKVDDEFTPEDKYFYLYLITNPHTNICGCYEVSKRQVERETGLTWDTIDRLLTRMEREHKVIRYCKETKEVLLVHWGKYNWGGSKDKIGKAVKNMAQRIKSQTFREFVCRAYDTGDFTFTTETVSEIENRDRDRDREQRTGIGIEIDGTIPYAYPMHTLSIPYQDGTYPQVIHKVIHSQLDNEILTMEDYEELCKTHDRVNVDSVIQRILDKRYHGCLNPERIGAWADEMKPSELPITQEYINYQNYIRERRLNGRS